MSKVLAIMCAVMAVVIFVLGLGIGHWKEKYLNAQAKIEQIQKEHAEKLAEANSKAKADQTAMQETKDAAIENAQRQAAKETAPVLLVLGLLMSGCATRTPVPVSVCPALPSKPSVNTQWLQESFSGNAEKNISEWRQRLESLLPN